MLKGLKEQSNITRTENGAVTYLSTGSHCLNLFSTIGAIRRELDNKIIARFIKAFSENKDIATKILFFSRDVRGGLGERRVFRVILRWLAKNEPETVIKNIPYISEYGRFDDLLSLIGTPCESQALKYLKNQFDLDMRAMETLGEVSLLAKWLPSINTSNYKTVFMAKKVAKSFNMDYATYRKSLSKLRAYLQIIENNLREKDYTFDYEKQPSKALFKYRNAFIRNDEERYSEFLANVEKGKAKLNASTLAPYELIEPFMHNGYLRVLGKKEKEALNATWNSLPNYCNNENSLAVVDVSGSMYCTGKPVAASVALSLGIYFAERNTGYFKDHFVIFSDRPKLLNLKGETFYDKLRYVSSFNDVANTNIEAVFDLILRAAVHNKVKQSELPSKIYLISDMEFDEAVENSELTNFENAKKKFEENGYKLPIVVFWNVASRNAQQPVTQNENGVVLVSGCTPKLFEMVASGSVNPFSFMMEVVESERYKKIVA